jgi:hypothetical protein
VDNNKKPWYIWLSFIGLFILLGISIIQFGVSTIRCFFRNIKIKKGCLDANKNGFDLLANGIYCWGLFFMLPVIILSLINEYIAKLLNIDGLDGWLNLPCLYFVGVNASWQHVKWRRKHGLDINKKEKER